MLAKEFFYMLSYFILTVSLLVRDRKDIDICILNLKKLAQLCIETFLELLIFNKKAKP